MSDHKETQFERWLKDRADEKKAPQPPDSEISSLPTLDRTDEPMTDARRLSPPLLSGKLATYLSEQRSRDLHGANSPLISPNVPLTINDTETRAAVAMAVILASHITRFASTTISETALLQFREQILKTFGAHDAVRLEIEAYDLLNWFAGAMNDSWAVHTSEPTRDEDKGLQDHIAVLKRAIDEKLDLDMSYYAGTRGEFSTRRITPIEISAEKYLIAYCHTRKENRRFRLSRILSLNWVNTPQTSLFDHLPDGSAPLADETKRDDSEEASETASKPQPPLSASQPTTAQATASVWIPDTQADDVRKMRARKYQAKEVSAPEVQPSVVPETPPIADAVYTPSDAEARARVSENTHQKKTGKRSPKKPPEKTTGFLPGFE